MRNCGNGVVNGQLEKLNYGLSVMEYCLIVEREKKEFEATSCALLGQGDSEQTLTEEEIAGAAGDLNSLVHQYAVE